MKPPQPATWLLTRFVRNDSFIGDLDEERSNGRSAVWYWRQLILAVLVATHNEIREHKIFAIRAVVIGYALAWLYFTYVWPWAFSVAFWMINFHEFLFTAGLTDWFYLHHVRLPTALLRFVRPGTLAMGWLAIGWVVGRLHGARIALAFTVIYVCGLLPEISPFVLRRGVGVIPSVSGVLCLAYISVLVGGLWGSARVTGGNA